MSCKEQAREAASRYDDFQEKGAEVAVIIPEDRPTAESWQESLDLPFPLLSDPESQVGDQVGQQVRFGFLGQLSDIIGRMPAAVILNTGGDTPEITHSFIGSSINDRPSMDEILEQLDTLQE